MIRYLSHYSSHNYMVYKYIPFDCLQEQPKGINICTYNSGIARFNNEEITIEPDEQLFFDSLGDDDVITVTPSGIARVIYDADASDNALFVTSMCNSNCIMCPSSLQSRKLGEVPDIKYIENEIFHYPSHLSHITITGGEPLLIGENIGRIFHALTAKDPYVNSLLLTNGRAFSIDSIFQVFNESAPHTTTIAIPIHGSRSEIHDRITNAPGSFNQTIAGIHNLLKKNYPVEIRIVISKLNIHDINNIADLLIAEFGNLFKVNFIGMEMSGNAAVNAESLWIPYKDISKAITAAVYKLALAGIPVGIYNFPLCQVSADLWSICERSISPEKVTYSDKCDPCKYKAICSGAFRSTFKYLENDMNPIEDDKC